MKQNLNYLNLFTAALFSIILQGCGEIHATKESPDSSATSVIKKNESATDVATQYVEIDGRKLAYRSIGNGKPFILCNRYRGMLDTWDPAFIDSLAKNYRVIIFDYSGFGLSTGAPATDMTSFAKDIKDLATALDFKTSVVGGWSFGGLVAQTFIAQYPQLVSHGVLIGTGPPGKNSVPIEPIFFERSSILNNTLEDETILFFEPAWEASRKAARLSHERIAKRTMTDRDIVIPEMLWGNYHKAFADCVEDKRGIRDKVMTSKVPMLVVSGDHDISFPVQNWYALVRKLQSTQIIVIPMTGHGPQHEYPELVARYISDFTQ